MVGGKALVMKLWVWEDVLRDYTAGLAVAVAPDLETALSVLCEQAGYDLELPVSKLKIIDLADGMPAQGWYVYGGG